MNVFNEISALTWLEVAKLQDGGFIVFALSSHGDRRRPDFACSSLVELFEYIAKKMPPTPNPNRSE